MIDLMLSNEGDIILEENEKMSQKIAINFLVTSSSPILISFNINSFTTPLKGMGISFYFGEESIQFCERLVKDQKALEQHLQMLFRTALSEIAHDVTYGSRLETIKHQLIEQQSFLAKAEHLAKEASKKLLPQASIKAKILKNSKGVCKLLFEITADAHTLKVEWEG